VRLQGELSFGASRPGIRCVRTCRFGVDRHAPAPAYSGSRFRPTAFSGILYWAAFSCMASKV
jgi:hypothetical protein